MWIGLDEWIERSKLILKMAKTSNNLAEIKAAEELCELLQELKQRREEKAV